MNDFGASFADCCYLLELFVRDAAIRYNFNNNLELADVSNSSTWWNNEFVTFSAGP